MAIDNAPSFSEIIKEARPEREQTPEQETQRMLREKVGNRLGYLLDSLDPTNETRKRISDFFQKHTTEEDKPPMTKHEQLVAKIMDLHADVGYGIAESHLSRSPEHDIKRFDFEKRLLDRLKRVKISKETLEKLTQAEKIMGIDHVFGPDAVIAMELILQSQGVDVEFGTEYKRTGNRPSDLKAEYTMTMTVPNMPYDEDDFFLSFDSTKHVDLKHPSPLLIRNGGDMLTFRPTSMMIRGKPEHITPSRLYRTIGVRPDPFGKANNLIGLYGEYDEAFYLPEKLTNGSFSYKSTEASVRCLRPAEALSSAELAGIHHMWGLTPENPLHLHDQTTGDTITSSDTHPEASALGKRYKRGKGGIRKEAPGLPYTTVSRMDIQTGTVLKAQLEKGMEEERTKKRLEEDFSEKDLLPVDASNLSQKQLRETIVKHYGALMGKPEKIYVRTAGEAIFDSLLAYVSTGVSPLQNGFDTTTTAYRENQGTTTLYQENPTGWGGRSYEVTLKTPAGVILVGRDPAKQDPYHTSILTVALSGNDTPSVVGICPSR